MSDILPWANIVSVPLQGDEAVRMGGVRSCSRAREVATGYNCRAGGLEFGSIRFGYTPLSESFAFLIGRGWEVKASKW